MNKNKNRYFWLLLALLTLVPTINIFAEGSKDLYPNNVRGGRATLYSGVVPSINMPFPTRGVHFVYAKPGETITMASSAQASSNNPTRRIRLYGPTGTDLTSSLSFSNRGRISNRNEELAGPSRPGQTGNNRYTPITYLVPSNGEGIYRVEFDGTTTTGSTEGRADSGLMANSDWSQKNTSYYIWAWDVSVYDSSGWKSGRVYTNVMNMDNNQQSFTSENSSNPNGFFGNVKVLTRDGYVYNVNNNGQNGLVFTFMVNNRGFHQVGSPNIPSYSSVNGSSLTNQEHAYNRYSDPREEDVGSVVTHKIFYNLPNSDLPQTALKDGKQHWLRVPEKEMNVEELKVSGVEGSSNQIGNKGAFIEFYNESGGDYYITISPKPGSGISFPVRELSGPSTFGDNKVLWDGKDGNLNPLPAGIAAVNIELKLRGAEVHFPYIDVEQNAFGIIIELLSTDLTSVRSDIVYWNDQAIDRNVSGSKSNPINASHLAIPDGTSSNSNGHRWATGNNTSTSGTWGDERGIDTWTFIEGDAITVDFDVNVKIADLEISEITHDKSGTVSRGEAIAYTVKVKNGDTDDNNSDIVNAPFSFIPPEGFIPNGDAVFEGSSCGTEAIEIVYNGTTKRYESVLNLPNGCEVTYTFPMTIGVSANTGVNKAEATIMRPVDVHDPDGTNTSDPNNPLAPVDQDPYELTFDQWFFHPTNPFFEAEYNGFDGNSNNIGSVEVDINSNITIAVDDFAETEQNLSVSGNVLDNDYDPEGHTQTVSTTGVFATVNGGSITISANGDYTYTPPTDYIGLDQFEYEMCDNGPASACDKAILLIGIGVCTDEVNGDAFDWEYGGSTTSPVTRTITQPSTNYGFVFDIYELDNSFNMEINGTKIADYEIEFQSSGTPGINVQFADGDRYEVHTTQPNGSTGAIWQMRGNTENPLIRVVISPTGSVTLYGSKASYGELYHLVLTSNSQGQNKFNNIPWNATGDNTIIITQNVQGTTIIDGYGYGQNWTLCPNYWIGGTDGALNEWSVRTNWTDNRVPEVDQTVEFATTDNNKGNPAVQDLHLDNVDQNGSGGRVIGKLVNNSDKNLVITTGNQLTINGEVVAKTAQGDGSFGTGTILVKSTNVTTNENEPTGTLLINPDNNPSGVQASVEFYNTAYDCADCGFYTRSWQYFGIPVNSSDLSPFTNDNEVNEWNEPTNGNKWITPNDPLTAFTGYQVTRNTTAELNHTNAVHLFNGSLNITNASVALTRTNNVNYSGVNLIGNSYTAAIPISTTAISIPTGVENTIYLFNTGTRDEWRKLNGNLTVGGVAGGQYLSVPINLAGENNLPDRIPSMHTFMVLVPEGSSGGNVGINYNQLVKNTTVNRGDGTQIVTRSAGASSETGSPSSIPALVMDVIGEQSADRVWLFAKENTTHGFDNGWDGRKMAESGIAQLYVIGTDESKLQVATVPSMDNVSLGFVAEADGKYTFEFSLSEHINSAGVFLHDQVTGISVELTNGASYTFEASKGETASRFRLTQSGLFGTIGDEALISVEQNSEGKIVIKNKSRNAVTAFISNSSGATLHNVEIDSDSETELDNIGAGLYVVRLQNAVMNDARRLIVK